MDQTTPRLNLPYLAANQAQKHVVLNDALSLLDGLVGCSVVSRTTAAEPSAPADGDAWLLPAGRTGAGWTPFPVGAAVRRQDGAWAELSVATGATVYVRDEQALIVRAAAGFVELLRVGVGGVGVGAAPASGGRLTVGGAPPSVGAVSAVASASGGLSLALSDNLTSSLYVRHLPGGAVIGTDGGGVLHLAADGSGSAQRRLSVDHFGAAGESALSLWLDFGAGLVARRVTLGAPDSAGAGFRMLRVAN